MAGLVTHRARPPGQVYLMVRRSARDLTTSGDGAARVMSDIARTLRREAALLDDAAGDVPQVSTSATIVRVAAAELDDLVEAVLAVD